VSDEADRAQVREKEIRADALSEHERWSQLHASRLSAKRCTICEEAISKARRLALPGVQTCIECQRNIEHGLPIKGF
jgi:phage/conjugal plasmid C-4 type zinc finger TraR family protein